MQSGKTAVAALAPALALALAVALCGAACKKDGAGTATGAGPAAPSGDGAPAASEVVVGGVAVAPPFDPQQPEAWRVPAQRIQEEASRCSFSSLALCIAVATGDPAACDDRTIAATDVARECRMWAELRAAASDPARCEGLQPPDMGIACRFMADLASFDCSRIAAAGFTAEQTSLAQRACDQVFATDRPQCPATDEEAGGDWNRGACELFVTLRARKEQRPDLCAALSGRTCRAFATGDPAACFDDAPAGLTAAAAIARARAQCRPFVLGESFAEESAGGTTKVGVLLYGKNLFEDAAAVRAHVTIRKGDTVTETFSRDLGTLAEGEDPQRFELSFEKPTGATHEVRWEAAWE